MMWIKSCLWGLMVMVLVSGCASYGHYTPTLDPYGDERADRIDQDLYECRYLAREANRYHSDKTAHGILMGGALGAVVGGLFGAVTGHAGTGMVLGATAGAVGGGVQGEMNAEQRYIGAYRNCMRNRGHNVIN